MADLSETIPIGEWFPDRADLENGGCLIAQNVTTDGEDYKPFPSFAAQSNALDGKCYGGYSHISSSGTVTTFLATRTKIYKLSGSALVDLTNAGGNYVTPVDGYWFFTQFGDRVIATNYVDNIQSFVVGVDTEFTDLISSGPNVKCRNFGVINNFLVAIDLDDDVGTTPNGVRWSPINDPSGDWTPSQSTQADYQFCEDGNPGRGMAVIGGQNYGVLVFKNAIYRMEYVGPPSIFSFILVEQGRGAVNPQAVTWNGSDVFYRAESGHWMFDGTQSVPIGQRKTDKYFLDDSDATYLYNMSCCSDPINKNILIAYTSTASPNGRNDKIACYNFIDQKFTEILQPCDILFRAFSSSYTLEDIGAAYPNIELVPYSFDSSFWSGGNTLLAGVVEDQLGYFQGAPMTAYMESQESRLTNNGLTYVQSILPVFEGGTCTVRLGSRNAINGTVTYTPYLTPSDTGEADFESESRYHRAGIKLEGEWTHFQGIRYRAEPGSAI